MTERGHHTLGSSNHLAIFGQDYLELLGYEPGRAPQQAGLHSEPPGLSGLVFKPGAPDFAERLRARGAPVGEAREFSRPVSLPEGARDARFRTAYVTDPALQSGRIFFCYHYTPELVWRDEWRRHPNGVTGVAEFVFASEAPERMGGLFRRLFGPESVRETEGGLCLPAGPASVLLTAGLFDAGLYNPTTKSPDVERWLRAEAYGDDHGHGDHGHGDHDHQGHGHDHHGHGHHHAHDRNRHDDHISAFCMTVEEPLAWEGFATWIETLITLRGPDLLRIKGILNVRESDTPVVVHGVQHVFHPPVRLEAWPSDDHRSRIVFITRDVSRETIEAMFEAYRDASE